MEDLSSFASQREYYEDSCLNKLKKQWLNEAAAPEILHYEERLVEEVKQLIKEKVSSPTFLPKGSIVTLLN